MRELTADIVIVGAGPAGIAAASAAADCRRGFVLVDENPSAGGQIWRQDRGHSPVGADLALLKRSGLGRFLFGAAVVQAEPDGVLLAATASGPVRLRYDRLVLATGARELFLPFPGWTLPGVMGAGGLQALVKGGWDIRGRRVAVAGSGPLLLAVAAFVRDRGAEVVCVAEQAPRSRVAWFGLNLALQPDRLVQAARLLRRLRGVPRLYGAWPAEARGDGRLQSVVLGGSGGGRELRCDLLACGFGLVPEVRLARLLGCALDGPFVRVDAAQQTSVAGVYCAGEPTGIGGLAAAMLEGQIAGYAAAGAAETAASWYRRRDRERRFALRLERAFALRPELRRLPRDETIVCRCEDVTFGAVRRYGDSRDSKLHTRCGMGPCQARVCGPALSFLLDWEPEGARPPLLPVPLGFLAPSRSDEGETDV